MITALVLAFVAFVAGVVVGRVGCWMRVQQIDSRLRALSHQAFEEELFGRDVSAAWVKDRVDWVVAQDTTR